jgi:hypothetical protein
MEMRDAIGALDRSGKLVANDGGNHRCLLVAAQFSRYLAGRAF